jgi:hypothetical protein
VSQAISVILLLSLEQNTINNDRSHIMYSTEELPLQDRQDFWNPLYTSFCRTICEKYKVEGEAVIRRAVGSVGYWQGEQQRRDYERSGISTDLNAFFQSGRALFAIPAP